MRIIIVIVFIIVNFFWFNLSAQNIFVLERPGTVRNYKYYGNERIKIRIISTDTVISGKITGIADSAISVNYANEILLTDIAAIYRTRWGFSLLQKTSLALGVAYISISALNGLINGDQPVVEEETLIISGCLIAGGLALTPLTIRKHKVDNKNWRVKILSFNY
jgi:hypothetical protein